MHVDDALHRLSRSLLIHQVATAEVPDDAGNSMACPRISVTINESHVFDGGYIAMNSPGSSHGRAHTACDTEYGAIMSTASPSVVQKRPQANLAKPEGLKVIACAYSLSCAG